MCRTLGKIGNSCPELLPLSHIWSLSQRLAPLIIPRGSGPVPEGPGEPSDGPPLRLWRLGLRGLLLCPQP